MSQTTEGRRSEPLKMLLFGKGRVGWSCACGQMARTGNSRNASLGVEDDSSPSYLCLSPLSQSGLAGYAYCLNHSLSLNHLTPHPLTHFYFGVTGKTSSALCLPELPSLLSPPCSSPKSLSLGFAYLPAAWRQALAPGSGISGSSPIPEWG